MIFFCSFDKYFFGGTCSFIVGIRRADFYADDGVYFSSALKSEVAFYSETLVHTCQAT